MSKRRRKYSAGGLFAVVVGGLLLAAPTHTLDKTQDVGEIPKAVMDALKAKFPKAKIDKWTREQEGGVVLFDIEFKQDGRKFEADIKEDGAIHNWEKAIAARDLPGAVKKAIVKKYPKARMKEIMKITAVKDGKDELEGYEIVLETADRKEVEVTVAADGKILEDSGDK